MAFFKADLTMVPPGLCLDELIGRFMADFPGAVITSQNWYAEEKQKAQLWLDRQPASRRETAQDVVDTYDRAEARNGFTKGIRLRVLGRILDGRISLQLMWLHSRHPITPEARLQLAATLQSAGVQAEVSWSDEPSPWLEVPDEG